MELTARETLSTSNNQRKKKKSNGFLGLGALFNKELNPVFSVSFTPISHEFKNTKALWDLIQEAVDTYGDGKVAVQIIRHVRPIGEIKRHGSEVALVEAWEATNVRNVTHRLKRVHEERVTVRVLSQKHVKDIEEGYSAYHESWRQIIGRSSSDTCFNDFMATDKILSEVESIAGNLSSNHRYQVQTDEGQSELYRIVGAKFQEYFSPITVQTIFGNKKDVLKGQPRISVLTTMDDPSCLMLDEEVSQRQRAQKLSRSSIESILRSSLDEKTIKNECSKKLTFSAMEPLAYGDGLSDTLSKDGFYTLTQTGALKYFDLYEGNEALVMAMHGAAGAGNSGLIHNIALSQFKEKNQVVSIDAYWQFSNLCRELQGHQLEPNNVVTVDPFKNIPSNKEEFLEELPFISFYLTRMITGEHSSLSLKNKAMSDAIEAVWEVHGSATTWGLVTENLLQSPKDDARVLGNSMESIWEEKQPKHTQIVEIPNDNIFHNIVIERLSENGSQELVLSWLYAIRAFRSNEFKFRPSLLILDNMVVPQSFEGVLLHMIDVLKNLKTSVLFTYAEMNVSGNEWFVNIDPIIEKRFVLQVTPESIDRCRKSGWMKDLEDIDASVMKGIRNEAKVRNNFVTIKNNYAQRHYIPFNKFSDYVLHDPRISNEMKKQNRSLFEAIGVVEAVNGYIEIR